MLIIKSYKRERQKDDRTLFIRFMDNVRSSFAFLVLFLLFLFDFSMLILATIGKHKYFFNYLCLLKSMNIKQHLNATQVGGFDFMITMFNRREVLLTTDMQRQAEARSILASHGIHFIVRTTYLHGQKGRMGDFGTNLLHSYEYKIYVHKKDFEKALQLIR